MRIYCVIIFAFKYTKRKLVYNACRLNHTFIFQEQLVFVQKACFKMSSVQYMEIQTLMATDLPANIF